MTARQDVDQIRASDDLGRREADQEAKAARDRAVIRLVLDLGLRRGDLARLDLEDIDREARTVWIRRRGRAQKECRLLPAPTLAALDAWLAVRKTVAAANETAVFVGVSGRRSRGRRLTSPTLIRRYYPFQ